MNSQGASPSRASTPAASLKELERIRAERGPEAAARKLALLGSLRRARLPRSNDLLRLHEALRFVRAYPDNPVMLRQVVRMLEEFPQRADLKRQRAKLSDSGIAGTAIHYRFYAETAAWLAGRHGAHLTVDWPELTNADELENSLPLLASYAETPALDQLAFSVRDWVRRMKGPAETDATFLIRRFQAANMDSRWREATYDRLDIPLVLAPGPATPSRTRAVFPTGKTSFRTAPHSAARPDLAREVARAPLRVRSLSTAAANSLVDLTRGMMVTMQRDLDAFSYADASDARLVEWGEGLAFGFVGALPERRLLLESLYGYVILQNGVPIGYGTAASLFRSSEVAFNVSPAFRGGEAAWVFARLLASTRALFGANSFTLDPYQIGQDNEEAVASGAWWFYQKLGFRARDPKVLALMEREVRRMRTRPGYRSSPGTLRRLAAANVFFQLGRRREDVLGRLPLQNVGLRALDQLAKTYGSRREEAAEELASRARRSLAAGDSRAWTEGERLAWRRWAPLLAVLPGVARWPLSDRRSLAATVRAKGGRCESEFVAAFDAHRRLRAAVCKLANDPRPRP